MAVAPARFVTPGGHARREGSAEHEAASLAPHFGMPVALGATAVFVYGPGHLSYDAGWALLWGKQLAGGQLPAFEAAGAPTPHPLANALTASLGMLGDGSGTIFIALGALAFGLLAYAAYLLGARCFGPLVGMLFAVLLFTRPRLVALQAQAAIDIPYLAFLLLAAAIAVRRPHRDGAVLACLTVAGLLRPEAWLFTAAYVAYRLVTDAGARRLRLLLLALIAPCVWVLFDVAVTGDPLHSLHGTRALAAAVGRPRGPGTALDAISPAFVDLLGAPLLIAGIAGGVAAIAILRRRALLPAAMVGLGLVAFGVVAAAGLSVISRYLIAPAALTSLFAVVAIVGWRELPRDDPRRLPWAAAASVLAVMLALTVPSLASSDEQVVHQLRQQRAVVANLRDLAEAPELRRRSDRVVHAETSRAVPLVAAWSALPLRRVSAQAPPRGTSALVIRPANPAIEALAYSSATPPWSAEPDPTVTWRELYRNRSWVLYETTPRRAGRGSTTSLTRLARRRSDQRPREPVEADRLALGARAVGVVLRLATLADRPGRRTATPSRQIALLQLRLT
jgi:hypothetical protein